MSESKQRWQQVLEETLAWSEVRDFAGHSKHDALNSPMLQALSLNNKFLRLVYTQVLMRAPVNLRGLCGVPQLRNPKGVGLFAHTFLDCGRVEEAEKLLSWLVYHASSWSPASEDILTAFDLPGRSADTRKLKGLGWGYHYPWQDAGFFQPRHFPNRVVTSWIGYAFIRAYEVTQDEKYLQVSREIVDFLLDNPRVLTESGDQLCLSYVPLDDIEVAVMDVSVLSGGMCARVGKYDDSQELQDTALRLGRFVVDKQTDYGAWYYTHPKEDSHITHDNYHTGIVLDCLADIMAYTGNRDFEQAYLDGLAHYEKDLFTEAGAPKWMWDKEKPHDIHGAANGILGFTRAYEFTGDVRWLESADRILTWTLDNLYSGEGRFYYQQTNFGTKRFTLMRWCNAWMCRAMSKRLRVGA